MNRQQRTAASEAAGHLASRYRNLIGYKVWEIHAAVPRKRAAVGSSPRFQSTDKQAAPGGCLERR